LLIRNVSIIGRIILYIAASRIINLILLLVRRFL